MAGCFTLRIIKYQPSEEHLGCFEFSFVLSSSLSPFSSLALLLLLLILPLFLLSLPTSLSSSCAFQNNGDAQ